MAEDIDPDSIAGVRYGDLLALEEEVNALRQSMADAKADLVAICRALHLEPAESITAHDLVIGAIVPMCTSLVQVKGLVDSYDQQIRDRVASGELEVQSFGGQKVVKVGQRLSENKVAKMEKRRLRTKRGKR